MSTSPANNNKPPANLTHQQRLHIEDKIRDIELQYMRQSREITDAIVMANTCSSASHSPSIIAKLSALEVGFAGLVLVKRALTVEYKKLLPYTPEYQRFQETEKQRNADAWIATAPPAPSITPKPEEEN